MTRKFVSNTRSTDVFRRIFLPLFFRDYQQRRMPAVSRIRLKFTGYAQQIAFSAIWASSNFNHWPVEVNFDIRSSFVQEWHLVYFFSSSGKWRGVDFRKNCWNLGKRIPAYFVPDPQLLRDVINDFQTRLEDVVVVSYSKSGELCLLTTFFLYLS